MYIDNESISICGLMINVYKMRENDIQKPAYIHPILKFMRMIFWRAGV